MAKIQYYVKERKRGGKRWRRCAGSTGDKAGAERYIKGMRKSFGDRFVYRLAREYK